MFIGSLHSSFHSETRASLGETPVCSFWLKSPSGHQNCASTSQTLQTAPRLAKVSASHKEEHHNQLQTLKFTGDVASPKLFTSTPENDTYAKRNQTYTHIDAKTIKAEKKNTHKPNKLQPRPSRTKSQISRSKP
jgi:hypothetical protein